MKNGEVVFIFNSNSCGRQLHQIGKIFLRSMGWDRYLRLCFSLLYSMINIKRVWCKPHLFFVEKKNESLLNRFQWNHKPFHNKDLMSIWTGECQEFSRIKAVHMNLEYFSGKLTLFLIHYFEIWLKYRNSQRNNKNVSRKITNYYIASCNFLCNWFHFTQHHLIIRYHLKSFKYKINWL